MTDWPAGFVVAPMREWPGTMTARRRRSQFDSTHSATLALLTRELRELGAKNKTLLIALRPEDFRLDGLPRAGRVTAHPGIVLSFGSKHGALSYPCDTFDRWEDNLRAIALALEALRKVDRYGVTAHGEQYRGFLALESGIAAPTGDPFHDAESALEWIDSLPYLRRGAPLAVRMRGLLRTTHPDVAADGGDSGTFTLATKAERLLREAGLL